MKKKSPQLILLNKIEGFIKTVHPPVEDFEKNIRTTPFQVLISVVISSRTKDQVTLRASQKIFKAAGNPEKMLSLGEKKIADLIYPVGFYRQKAKHIMGICRKLIDTGAVPDRFEDLISLPGVGRKTANLVLALAFNKPSIAVDTHVFRISRRLGWTGGKTPGEVESELMKLFDSKYWNKLNQTLVGFGQTVCKPVKPDCPLCPVNDDCPSCRM